MTDTNIDKIVDKVLKDKYLTPAKIKALATVIQALKGITVNEPNTIPKEETNDENFTLETEAFPISEVTGVEIDGEKKGAVKIYKT